MHFPSGIQYVLLVEFKETRNQWGRKLTEIKFLFMVEAKCLRLQISVWSSLQENVYGCALDVLKPQFQLHQTVERSSFAAAVVCRE